jgi:Family of unknown function (DUF6600)/FecR protein
MKRSSRITFYAVGMAIVLGLAATLAWAEEYSHARIVRLSFVEGAVAVQQPDVEEWAEALVNTPIQEGFKVSTAEDGFAEVEFENASTARLGQGSLLEFTQLALAPSGGKVNRLTLHQGYATFNFIPENDDYYKVRVGDATLTPQGKSRFRLDVEESLLLVKVFKGSVEITSPEGTGTVGENATLEFRPGEEPAFQISQGITKDAWDEWVENREEAAQVARARSAPAAASAGVSDLFFGSVDLALYGEWSSNPDYGYVWYPFANRGWNPYAAGRWCWYPGYGYVWISGEPWGWLPYHYGYWVFDSRVNGWCWIPGGFATWSPALVTWYRGPGWVGWAPRGSPRLHGSWNDCRNPRGCGVVVSEDTFRNGGPVQPGRVLNINPETNGRRLDRPDIEPDHLARLPGEPYRRTGAPQRPQDLTQTGSPEGGQVRVRSSQVRPTVSSAGEGQHSISPSSQPGVVRERAPSSGGIAFDPEERRYVNSTKPAVIAPANPPVQPEPTSTGRARQTPPARVVPGEAQTNKPSGPSAGGYRPASQGNSASRSTAAPRGAPTTVQEHMPSPPSTSAIDSSDARQRSSRDAGSQISTIGSRSTGGRSSDSPSPRPSITVSSPPSESSSSSRISTGGSSGSSGGGAVSVRSSGSSSGGSSGGSHVSSGSSSSGGSRSSSGGDNSGGSSGGRSSSGGRPPRQP